jgi:hypothetical protein
MAMGLASMNPIPGATKQPTHGVVLIRPEDEDKPKYGVTSDFNANKYIALDSGNKPQIRDIKELDECGVEVFIIKDPASDAIFNKLVEMASDPTLNRPLEGNLYEVFSNHTQYTEDQYRYDPLLEKVYMDKIEKTFEGIQKEVDSIKQHDRTMTSHKLNLDPMTTDKGDLDGEGLCFPILASADLEKIDSEYEAILRGERDSIVED